LRKAVSTLFCLTMLLSTQVIADGYSKCLTSQAIRDYLSKGERAESPDLPYFFDTEHFRLWYDTSGTDAVFPDDDDDNGIPDYIEKAGEYFEYAWNIVIDSLGYREPIPDSMWLSDSMEYGGDSRVDVYFIFMGLGIYGVTMMRESNPDSISTKATAFIEIQSDMTRIADYADNPYPPLMVTCAHEFMHTVQFAYRYPANDTEYEMSIWWMEATAVFNEEFCFNDVNDYYLYLPRFQENPEIALFENDSRVVYGAVIFPMFIEEFFAPESIRMTGLLVKNIWELCEYELPVNAVRNFLEDNESSLEQIYSDFTYWRLRTGSYWRQGFFAEGYDYPLPSMDTIELTDDTTCQSSVKTFATEYFVLPYSTSNDGVLASLSSSSTGITAELLASPLELSSLSPDYGYTLTTLDDTIGISGRWQYHSIVYAPLVFAAPMTADLSLWIEASDSLSVPMDAVNRIFAPYPNPCINSSIKFPVEIVVPGNVYLHIFTAFGEPVCEKKESLELPQNIEFIWEGKNRSGGEVSPGIYIFYITAGSQSLKGKILLVK